MNKIREIKSQRYTGEPIPVSALVEIDDIHRHHLTSDRAREILDRRALDQAKDNGISGHSRQNPVEAGVGQGSIVRQVLNRAASDRRFWLELLENGPSALSGYRLSSEARAAIASGDVRWVRDHVGDIPERQKGFLNKRLEREAW